MASEMRIEWHGVPRSQALEADARREAARIAEVFPGVHVTRVTFESLDPQGSLTGPVCAGVEVRAPERQVIVNREHDDPADALRDACEVVFHAFDRRRRDDRRSSATPRA